MIAIMNYGIGNLGSVKNALDFLGFDAKITSDPSEILSADKVILPGVGAFSIAMDTFKSYGFVEVVNKLMEKNTPILGICVGMQMLFQESEEYGIHEGLGLLQGRIIKFKQTVDNITYKIPQMGWNQIHVVKDNPLLNGLDLKDVYFVHSYHAKCDSKENVLMTCDYGYEFACAVVRDNIYGVQFHPEKSHDFGMALLENFVRRC